MGMHKGLLRREAFRYASEAAKYLIVGAVNTLLTLAAIFLLTLAGADYRLGNAVGYGIGLLCSYILNRLWTFRSHGAVAPQVLKFLLVFCVCYAAQFGLLVLMVEWLRLSHSFSQIAAMGVYTALGYLLSRILVYR
jgi:putative flippase GtrA